MQHTQRDQVRLTGLDSVRGLAIIMVVIFHYAHDRIFTGLINIIIGPFGLGGVTLFFLLSGFLIERHLAYDNNLVRYFTRRIFRVIPAYLACLAVILVIDQSMQEGRNWTSRDIAINAILLQDILGAPLTIGVIWTLLIEIKFYALAPFVKRAGALALRLAPYAAIAANSLVFAARLEGSTFLTYLTFCFVGMQFGPWTRDEMSGRALTGLVIAAAFATYLFGTYFAVGLAIFVVIDAAILAVALQWPLTLPILPFVGRVSYSWYLYHAAVGYPLMAILVTALAGTTAAPLIVVTITTIATITVAWLSFMIIERPGIAFGQWCEKRLRLLPPRSDSAGKSRQNTA
jgi:peptidoglycan/LPS O-acetylase OafA/YrhL